MVQTITMDMENRNPSLAFAGRKYPMRAQIYDFVLYYTGGRERELWALDEIPARPVRFTSIESTWGKLTWRPHCIEPHSPLPEMSHRETNRLKESIIAALARVTGLRIATFGNDLIWGVSDRGIQRRTP